MRGDVMGCTVTLAEGGTGFLVMSGSYPDVSCEAVGHGVRDRTYRPQHNQNANQFLVGRMAELSTGCGALLTRLVKSQSDM